MYILGSNLTGIPILSLQTGQTHGKTLEPIIEPGNLELLAFFVHTGTKQPSVVLLRDVRRVTGQAVVIDSEEDISDPADIVRLQETIGRKFKLLGVKVVSESGQKLGTVEDFTVGLTTYKVQKIYVKPPLFKQLLSSKLIIDRGQIVDVTNDKITVRDATVTRPVMAPGVKVVPTE